MLRLFTLGLLTLTWLWGQSQPVLPPTLLLTELYYDTPGVDAEEEWFEISNLGTAVIDLSTVSVGDEEMAGGNEGMLRFPREAVINPGQTIVVAQTATGFRTLFAADPDYEIQDTDPAIPDMRRFPIWSDGDLALGNEGDELLLLIDMVLVDALSYGDSDAVFDPPLTAVFTGQSVERLPATCDTDSAADWQPQQRPTPGIVTLDGECPETAVPAHTDTLPPIGAIQGTEDVAARVNEIVTFHGIVTGMREDQNASGIIFYTVFVQDLPGQEDGDPATSDAIAVFLGRERPSLQIGDLIQVTGQVTEFFGYTEIDDNDLEIIVEAEDQPLPTPVPIDPPANDAAQRAALERFESMRVTLPDTARVVGSTFSGCSFAVVRQDSGLERVFRRETTDPAGQVIPIMHTSDVQCGDFPHLKSGDLVTGVTGPLIYNFDQFKIVQQETAALTVTAAPLAPIPTPPTLAADQFTVASFNLENHFDAVDDTGDDAEPKPSPAEIAIKQEKLAHTVAAVLGCPTLLGVQEVENEALLQDLAGELAPRCGFTYQVTHRESADARGIDVALLTHPDRVAIIAADLRQGCTQINTGITDETAVCPAGQSPLFSRPPLQIDLQVDGHAYTLFVNHFKSKRGGELETAPRRLLQAVHLNELAAALSVQNPDVRIIALGDFNDYEQAPGLQELTTNGRFTNVLLQIPAAERYSFVFSGVSQLIDGILVSDNLAPDVAAVTIQHTNADYPDILGQDTDPADLPYRSSDHDPSLLLLNLPATASPAPATAVPAATATPSVPVPDPDPGLALWPWLLGVFGIVGTAIILFLRRRTI